MVIRMVLPKQYYRDLSIRDLSLCLDNVSSVLSKGAIQR